jgi:hypothetical protein
MGGGEISRAAFPPPAIHWAATLAPALRAPPNSATPRRRRLSGGDPAVMRPRKRAGAVSLVLQGGRSLRKKRALLHTTISTMRFWNRTCAD